ncbi:DUF2007 domain-containing protein [Echinicola soli]|uniref:DUF2007 domain-containing protein n=1 Tax=Echinicola soli TaxID=2591634 RepID=A0A514CF53_9BACT|nr:DUF2007 domain-containing protein [Echinicola soli]QDH78467.1 DUF2007 domain-containing protein [Echinicola soli]
MKLITIDTLDNAVKAHLIKSKLESEGIPTFLHDEGMVTLYPVMSPALGGIKLKVPQHKAEEAMAILRKFDHQPVKDDKGDIVKCSHCGSEHLIAETSSWRDSKGIFSMLLALFFLVLPIYLKTVYRCLDCNKLTDKD